MFVGIFNDLSKAFDLLSHIILLDKVKYIGIMGVRRPATISIVIYVIDRKMYSVTTLVQNLLVYREVYHRDPFLKQFFPLFTLTI